MYIFDLEKFIESCIEDGDSHEEIMSNLEWARKIDGKIVDRNKGIWASCDRFLVDEEWCREVDHVLKFSKELYLQKSEVCDDWCNLIDGEIVGFEKSDDEYGMCKDFIILKEWCVTI